MGAARRQKTEREHAAALLATGQALSDGRGAQVAQELAQELGRLRDPRGFLLYLTRIDGEVLRRALAALEAGIDW